MKNNNTSQRQLACFLVATGLLFSSCTTVKPYERIYLNDAAMQLGDSDIEQFENYVHSIREGAIPGSDSKSGGGCGCN